VSKKPVTIGVSSVQEDGDAREVTTRAHRGHLYEKEGATWLLYEDDGTSTTMRLGAGEIRIHRRGLVNSWQDFRPGEVTGGLLSVGEGAGGEMVLRVRTERLVVTQDPARGRIELVYDLFTGASAASDADPMDVSLGRFTLDLVWDALEP
jgi:uncharacterized beta-barrel protein YwiB (DUF1934 family)